MIDHRLYRKSLERPLILRREGVAILPLYINRRLIINLGYKEQHAVHVTSSHHLRGVCHVAALSALRFRFAGFRFAGGGCGGISDRVYY